MRVARLAERVPRALDELESGSVHLTGLFLLSQHVTQENADALLDQAKGKSRREIEVLVATWFPKPDVPDSIEPEPRRLPLGDSNGEPCQSGATTCPGPGSSAPPSTSPGFPGSPGSPGSPGRIEPLSKTRYRIEFSASATLRDKIERARELASHAVPNGDLATLIERAIDHLIEHETKRQMGADRATQPSEPREPGKPSKPRQPNEPREPRQPSEPREPSEPGEPRQPSEPREPRQPGEPSEPPQREPGEPGQPRQPREPRQPGEPREPRKPGEARELREPGEPGEPRKPGKPRKLGQDSRHVPRDVARIVRERDGHQCTFVDATGRRCSERRFITIEHDLPFARGGLAIPENLRLLCKAHNHHSARKVFGKDYITKRTTDPPRTARLSEHTNIDAKVLGALVRLGFKKRDVEGALRELAASHAADVPTLLRAALGTLVLKNVRS